MFFCFLFWAQLVTSHLLFIIFAKNISFWGQRGQKNWVFLFFQKHYKNRFFIRGSPCQYHPKTCFTNCQLVTPKNVFFIKKLVFFLVPFLPSNHYFCKAKSLLEKVPDFVPGFLGETLIGQKWCTLSCAQLEENKKKSSETTIFLQ